MSNNYFEDQNEVTGRTWPTETWFQKRRRALVLRKEWAGILDENEFEDHKSESQEQ